MSIFIIFLLGFTLLIQTTISITDPIRSVRKTQEGKTLGEFKEEFYKKNNLFRKSLVVLLCTFFSSIATFIINPLFVIFALKNKIGYQPINYVILTIILTYWVISIFVFVKELRLKSKSKNIILQKEDGTEKELIISIIDKKGKRTVEVLDPNNKKIEGHMSARDFICHILYFIPILYLWYIFFIVIDTLN